MKDKEEKEFIKKNIETVVSYDIQRSGIGTIGTTDIPITEMGILLSRTRTDTRFNTIGVKKI